GFRDLLRRRPELFGALAVAALLLWLVNGGMWWFFRFGASEVPTWLLLPAAVGLLFGPASRVAWAAGSALVGLWAALRLNDLPAALFLLLLFTLLPGQRRERVAWAVGGLALFLTAVLLHNVVYGSELAFIRAEPMTVDGKTVVGSDSGLSALGNLVAAVWDATARGEVGTNARALLYLDGGLTAENLAQRLVIHGLLLAWLAASAWLVLSWRETTWVAKGMAALPLVVLGPFLAFDVTAYYPRQIVLGYVAMGVSVIYVLGRLDDARLKGKQGSRRGLEVRDGASRDEIGAAMDIPDREPLDPVLPPGGPDHASTRQL
ncbi:MAG: hypothetical protein M3131_08900, partial [Actinomycetota bacterium]|nr:hypothetical protein [Actinomycetota bacterium]